MIFANRTRDTEPSARLILRRSDGSSMVEILIAISFLALVAAGFSKSTVSLVKGNSSTGRASAAAALTHDLVERFRALDPDSDPIEFEPGDHVDANSPLDEYGGGGGIYQRSWTVNADSPRKGIAEVAITISWNSPNPEHLRSITYVCTTATCS